LLREARHAIALTGAGISTPSGIPDFRSPGVGLWEHADPMAVASIEGFRRDPRAFYTWIRPLLSRILEAEPNAGHVALADLEAGGRLEAVITQNIDGLHQRSGSQEVLELHGHLREVRCMACHRVAGVAEVVDDFIASGEAPLCSLCGGVMRPCVVLYGEELPGVVLEEAMEHVGKADLILVAGSSLETTPASQLPARVHARGGRVIVVNLIPTYVDRVAQVVVHADVTDVLPRMAQACVED
jgi:NAD-dependent deacetylase